MPVSAINKARGEAAIEIGGATHRLCLTLGALAEIEAALGAESLAELERKLKVLTARDFATVLCALLRGGGNPLSEDVLASVPLDLGAVTQALTATFSAAGLGSRSPPSPRDAELGEVSAPSAGKAPGGAGSLSALVVSG